VREAIEADQRINQSQLKQLHARFPKFFQKFFTLCNYYLSLFGELANSTRNRGATQSATSTTLAEAIEQNMSQMSNFNLAKTFMKELFLNLEELKSENDVALNRIFENCVRLLNDE
jgi:predicted DNA-binding protein